MGDIYTIFRMIVTIIIFCPLWAFFKWLFLELRIDVPEPCPKIAKTGTKIFPVTFILWVIYIAPSMSLLQKIVSLVISTCPFTVLIIVELILCAVYWFLENIRKLCKNDKRKQR